MTAQAKEKTRVYLFKMLWDFYERIGEAIALNDIYRLSNEDLGYIAADLSRINAELAFLMRPKPKKKAVKKRVKK